MLLAQNYSGERRCDFLAVIIAAAAGFAVGTPDKKRVPANRQNPFSPRALPYPGTRIQNMFWPYWPIGY